MIPFRTITIGLPFLTTLRENSTPPLRSLMALIGGKIWSINEGAIKTERKSKAERN